MKTNNRFENQIYALENKRFEIIHVRSNKETGFFHAYARDEYEAKDIEFSADTMRELFDKVKNHIDEAGLSLELRKNPEPIAYK